MSDTSFITQIRHKARRDLEKKIARLKRRLAEVEELSVGPFSAAEAEALSAAIRASLLDSSTLASYGEAANFYNPFSSITSQVEITESTKARSVAFFKRAIQSLSEQFDEEVSDADRTTAAKRRPALAGLGMVGITRVGSGVDGIETANASSGTILGELTANATAEVGKDPGQAYDLLMARVALLEAALASPKPRQEIPIGPGHNGPPEFEPPFEESEIRELVDLLKAQGPTSLVGHPLAIIRRLHPPRQQAKPG